MTSTMDLSGKVSVITGAGSGVGRATALELARRGMSVGLVGRTASTLDETAAMVKSAGGRALVAAADVGQESEVRSAISAISNDLGRIDALICAAAIERDGPVSGYSLEDWNATFSANVTGVFLCCRE